VSSGVALIGSAVLFFSLAAPDALALFARQPDGRRRAPWSLPGGLRN
jgi:hypothetical protein